MPIPKVFISYSHDSREHKKWVLNFATRLRTSGIDAILDQWDLKHGGDLPVFMETGIRDSDKILIICTNIYTQKANAGQGGVGYEKMILTSELIKNIKSDKIIPIVRQNGIPKIPTFLESKFHINFSDDKNNEFNYDELLRTLLNSPLFTKPPIGKNPFGGNKTIKPQKTNDPIKELMTKIIKDYESGKDYSLKSDVYANIDASRIMSETIINDAINKGLISKDREGDFILRPMGKRYAIENKLI